MAATHDLEKKSPPTDMAHGLPHQQRRDSRTSADRDVLDVLDDGQVINASGHVQELDKQFSLLSMCAVGIVTGNTWAALGGSIVVAIYNGGPPGAIYELIAVPLFYFFVAASIGELASAIPSAAGVYHWASVTPGKRLGRAVGFFAGWWNMLAWCFGASSMACIVGNITVAMYGLWHDDFVAQRWHVFVAYLIACWLATGVVMFGNRLLPLINNLGLLFVLGGWFITVLVCAIMPSTTGAGHASSAFVWRSWANQTGWSSNGFVFVAGMLNGAYAIGTPDCTSHISEEIPRPAHNVPRALAAQMSIGFITALVYLIAIFYAITDLDAVLGSSSTFPLAAIYLQATGSRAGATGLLVLVLLPIASTVIGATLTAGRTFWTLARDGAVPFSHTFAAVSPRWGNPFAATLFVGCFSTVMGCIYLGSSTAFNAFIGSFVILTTCSYFAAIFPHLASGRRGVAPGPFWMKGWWGFVVNGVSCAYIAVFVVVYCFPYAMPVDAGSMNYSCLIVGGLTILVGGWWAVVRGRYEGPPLVGLH